MGIHRSVSSYQNLLTSGDHALILCLLVLTIQQLVRTILIELQTGLLNYSNVHTYAWIKHRGAHHISSRHKVASATF